MYRVSARHWALLLAAFGLACAVEVAIAQPGPGPSASPPPSRPGPTGSPSGAPAVVDGTRLERLLLARGFTPPPRFKALVVELGGGVRRAPAGSTGEPAGAAEPAATYFDWRGTSDDRDDWWPASSVKLYAAIAALEVLHGLGFSPNAALTFHYDAAGEEEVTLPLAQIVDAAIVPSNNAAFNRLVEIVGFDGINRDFFTARNGLGGTVFLRAYNATRRDPITGHGVNRYSPRISIVEGTRHGELPARVGSGQYPCPDQGNCTTLRQLAEAMRRVMLHEHLPAAGRFALGPRELAVLRRALLSDGREHGILLVEALQLGFGADVPLRVYHKPGYANRWISDVMFVRRTDTDQRWLVALAAWSGRRVLDEALRHVGAILASGELGCEGGGLRERMGRRATPAPVVVPR